MMCENLCKQSSFVHLLHETLTTLLQNRPKSRGGGEKIPLPRVDVPYTLYGLEHCPYSARAAAALRGRGIGNSCTWTLSDLGVTRQALWAELEAKTDFEASRHKTFPICFRGHRFLGGCDDLIADLAAV